MDARQNDSRTAISSLVSTHLARSVYASRLSEFSDFTFADHAAFQFRGAWRDYFRRRIGPAFDGQIILEIGCFNAVYLSKIAAKYPTIAFIGLDWKCKPIYDGAQRVAGLGLNNVALLRARGQDLPRIFAESEVDEIWVFHPEPCDHDPKSQSCLIGDAFLGNAHQALRKTSSVLAFKTDRFDYYQWMLNLFEFREGADDRISVRNRFDIAFASPSYWQDPAAIRHTRSRCFWGEVTAYENRFLKKRLAIHYVELRKR